jgi:hypothetical protein
MNSKTVQELVVKYKNTTKRHERNQLFLSIKNEYALIIHNLSKDISKDDIDEFDSIVNLELCNALSLYDSSRKVIFVTYFYNYLKSCRRKYFKYSNLKNIDTNNNDYIDDISILEFNIDKSTILDEHMTLLYLFLCSKRNKIQKSDLKLLGKLKEYFKC